MHTVCDVYVIEASPFFFFFLNSLLFLASLEPVEMFAYTMHGLVPLTSQRDTSPRYSTPRTTAPSYAVCNCGIARSCRGWAVWRFRSGIVFHIIDCELLIRSCRVRYRLNAHREANHCLYSQQLLLKQQMRATAQLALVGKRFKLRRIVHSMMQALTFISFIRKPRRNLHRKNPLWDVRKTFRS